MFKNLSPWLSQLNRTRPIADLDGDLDTDVAIIGGGIAGVATAFYALNNTDKRVALIEADKIAHGASGHNGGFLATYFERTFASLTQEFGLPMAARGQEAIESAWELLEQIQKQAQLKTPIWQFTGYAACATPEEVLHHLRTNALRHKAGLPISRLLVSQDTPHLRDIPDLYKHLYDLAPQSEIQDLLETNDQEYIAALPERKGCMNSASFCEELVTYLLATFPERFTLAEHCPVRRLVLRDKYAILDISRHRKVVAKEVVLCTNGFENLTIVNMAGPGINKKFHHLVRGIVGYMAGYLEQMSRPAAEINYLPKHTEHTPDVYTEEPYFYLTRRPFEDQKHHQHSLVTIGGPEALMDDTNNYKKEHPFPEEAREQIDNFLRYTYRHGPRDHVDYQFFWHGLMGFTPNGIRLIGPEPLNPLLYYNLGCNGVGLLPSIYGGQKISWHLAGKKVEPSIFDPKDIRSIRRQRNNKLNDKTKLVVNSPE